MANTYKNIVITPNRDTDAANVPVIRFSGGNGTTNTDINVRVYTTQGGTLSFEGSAGQLFSITNDLTNTIFSVNDVSGIPSIEVNANGLITLAPYGGNVGIGRSSVNTNHKLDVAGVVNASAYFVNGLDLSLENLPGAWTKKAVKVATTAALTVTATSSTLTNAGTLAALVIDGVTLAVNDRVLVKDQASSAQNGIYIVTNIGSVSVAWVLTRSNDANIPDEIAGGTVNVDSGTVNDATLWTTSFTPSGTIGTTAMPWYRIFDSSQTLGIANGGTGANTAGAADTALRGFTSTATAGGTTTWTSANSLYNIFTGTSNQTITLPVTSTLGLGWSFHIVNNSTGTLTVNSSGGNAVIVIPSGTTAMVTCILTSGTSAASWEAGLTDFSTYTGTGNLVLATSPTISEPTISGNLIFDTTTSTRILDPAANNLAFITTNLERARIDSSGYMQGTVNGLSAGRIPAMQYYRLNTDLARANVTTVQSTFGVGVTLVANTVYEFESEFILSKTTGNASHVMNLAFGGTATINNILYGGISSSSSVATPTGYSATVGSFDSTTATSGQQATLLVGVGNIAYNHRFHLRGTVSINAGGTFIPQFSMQFLAGTYSTLAGSWFRIFPVATSGTVSIGSWA